MSVVASQLSELRAYLDEEQASCKACKPEKPCKKCGDKKPTDEIDDEEELETESVYTRIMTVLEEEEQDLEQLDEIVGAIKRLIAGAKSGYKTFGAKGTNLKTKAGRDKAKKGLGDTTKTVAGTIGGMVGGIAGRAARGIKKAVYKSERKAGAVGTSGTKTKSKQRINKAVKKHFKQEKPACPKGEKMTFGQCQKVGK